MKMSKHDEIEALLQAIEKGAPTEKVAKLAAKARKAEAGSQSAAAGKPVAAVVKPVALKVASAASVLGALGGSPRVLVAKAVAVPKKRVGAKKAAIASGKTKVLAASAAVAGAGAGAGVPSHPTVFPLKGGEFRIRIEEDMYGMYDRTGEGVMYELDVVFSSDFFAKPPCEAWTPECVSIEAVGFSKSDESYLASLGIKPSAWEKRALGALMQEPWLIFEKIEFKGANAAKQDAWMSANGYWDPVGDGTADAVFAKHFKKNKISPAH
jgi:hypothetical protein